MREKLAALFALQQHDSALEALKRAAAALDPGIGEHAAYKEARTAAAILEERVTGLTTEIRDAELEKKTVLGKKKQVETKFSSGKITGAKETQTHMDEIAMLEKQAAHLDEKLILLHTDLEEAQSQAKDAKAKLEATTNAFNTINDDYKKQIAVMQAQAKDLLKQRARALKEAPIELLPRYEALRSSRNGVAIVILEDGNACGGCKMGLGSALVGRVKASTEISTCDNCQRILFAAERR